MDYCNAMKALPMTYSTARVMNMVMDNGVAITAM
jgi:hypothetical protein